MRSARFLDNAISFMTNSGTESVEAAIKLARHYTGATEFIGFLGAFHGHVQWAQLLLPPASLSITVISTP